MTERLESAKVGKMFVDGSECACGLDTIFDLAMSFSVHFKAI